MEMVGVNIGAFRQAQHTIVSTSSTYVQQAQRAIVSRVALGDVRFDKLNERMHPYPELVEGEGCLIIAYRGGDDT